MTVSSHNFWDYSVALYDRDGVAAACLFLQDNLDLDVNLLLFCIWYARFRGELNPALLVPILEFSARWKQEVVHPQRKARRWMKANPVPDFADGERYEILRERIKMNELAAEKFQQETIQSMTGSGSEGDGVAAANLGADDWLQNARRNIALLLKSCKITLDAASEERLELILQQAAGD